MICLIIHFKNMCVCVSVFKEAMEWNECAMNAHIAKQKNIHLMIKFKQANVKANVNI
jgi:hypothetical protein